MHQTALNAQLPESVEPVSLAMLRLIICVNVSPIKFNVENKSEAKQ